MAVTNLVKLAYELKDHQKRVSNKIDQGGNVLAYHSLGSGKTLTSLDAAVKKIQAGSDKVQFVVPAPLRSNRFPTKHRDRPGSACRARLWTCRNNCRGLRPIPENRPGRASQ